MQINGTVMGIGLAPSSLRPSLLRRSPLAARAYSQSTVTQKKWKTPRHPEKNKYQKKRGNGGGVKKAGGYSLQFLVVDNLCAIYFEIQVNVPRPPPSQWPYSV